MCDIVDERSSDGNGYSSHGGQEFIDGKVQRLAYARDFLQILSRQRGIEGKQARRQPAAAILLSSMSLIGLGMTFDSA